MNQTTNLNQKSKPTRLQSAACLYASKFGFAVHPLLPKGKTPISSNGCKDATCNQLKIINFFSKNPNANIGIATGLVSGIGVLDIDPKPDALKILEELESEFGRLPETPHVITGSGGFHFYFKVSEAIPNRTGIRHGVDYRGDGGYVVSPPSIHSNGSIYEWEACHHINDIPLAPIPIWLKTLVIGASNSREQKRPQNYWSQMLQNGVTEGARNQSLAEVTGHLLRRFIDPELTIYIVKSINNEYVKPPLPLFEVEKIIESIAGKELKRRKALNHE